VVLTLLVTNLASSLLYSLIPHDSIYPIGIYAPNDLLTKGVRRIGVNLHGPETITFDKDGNAYGFTVKGQVVSIDLDTGIATEWAFIGGRPLAGEFDHEGNLYVCDAIKGDSHSIAHRWSLNVFAEQS
jgi:sugar lactone lactonase YvrE